MIVALLLRGPLAGKYVELPSPHAYELFQLPSQSSGDQEREQWAYYRIHPLDTGVTTRTQLEPKEQKPSDYASRVLTAKPGRGSGSKKGAPIRRRGNKESDCRYLFVKVVDENACCVRARKEAIERELLAKAKLEITQ